MKSGISEKQKNVKYMRNVAVRQTPVSGQANKPERHCLISRTYHDGHSQAGVVINLIVSNMAILLLNEASAYVAQPPLVVAASAAGVLLWLFLVRAALLLLSILA